ncbi:hypothetical protein Pryu01_00786 [Paraliobacillus ryukyuensis]|uniref:Uncharacterized protein n=1 Tax=Paraliobacillus ryukyuensis TaxID=200904 RepID=A0A366EDZ5_9BACI|nr:hypothetical protein DES48_102406 [Paraliobacillus ryukyuensis]
METTSNIAIITDIHGNYAALKTVLNDIAWSKYFFTQFANVKDVTLPSILLLFPKPGKSMRWVSNFSFKCSAIFKPSFPEKPPAGRKIIDSPHPTFLTKYSLVLFDIFLTSLL